MTYVLSDIHGNERRFDSVLKQICLQLEDGRVFYSREEKIVKKTQFPL